MANHFPCSQLKNFILPSHKMKLVLFKNKVSSTRVLTFPVNRTLRFFSCLLLANNSSLTSLNGQLLEGATCFLRLQINLFLSHAYLEWDSTNSYHLNQLNKEKRENKAVQINSKIWPAFICMKRGK